MADNAENGHPSCANGELLNGQLRSWSGASDAIVSTDCGAINNLLGPPVNAPDSVHAVAWAFMNGTDIEGGGVEWNNLSRAIDQGLATEARLDEAVRRSFKPHFEVGRFDPPGTTGSS